jgi:hypothetical protein
MDVDVIPDKDLKVGKANVDGLKDNKSIRDFGATFADNAPLWFYVLAEAQHQWAVAAAANRGKDDARNAIPIRLGPVGGRIVAEVLVGLLLGDPFSFLSQWPSWRPWFTNGDRFGMAELIEASGLA